MAWGSWMALLGVVVEDSTVTSDQIANGVLMPFDSVEATPDNRLSHNQSFLLRMYRAGSDNS